MDLKLYDWTMVLRAYLTRGTIYTTSCPILGGTFAWKKRAQGAVCVTSFTALLAPLALTFLSRHFRCSLQILL